MRMGRPRDCPQCGTKLKFSEELNKAYCPNRECPFYPSNWGVMGRKL